MDAWKMRSFCRKIHVHKIPRFRGGYFGFGGRGKCRFYFYGRADFSDLGTFSGGRGCLGEGRLGLPCRVWELRSLPSFPSFPREIAIQTMSGKTPGSPRHPSTRHLRGLLTSDPQVKKHPETPKNCTFTLLLRKKKSSCELFPSKTSL